jgi:hypothetical protein
MERIPFCPSVVKKCPGQVSLDLMPRHLPIPMVDPSLSAWAKDIVTWK